MSDTSHAIKWGRSTLYDLDLADDIALLSNSHDGLQIMTNRLSDHGEKSCFELVAIRQRP